MNDHISNEALQTDGQEQRMWLRAYVESNDRAALDRLLALHLDAAYRAAWMFLRHEQDAADVVQEAFINVMKSAPSFKGDSSVRSWIMSIVINACHNKHRGEQRLKQREAEFAEQQITVTDAASIDHEVLKELVQQETAALPELYRVPLMLHYVEEYSVDEIASTLNKSMSAVRKQLQRGIEQLREAVASHGYQMSTSALLAVLFVDLPAAAPMTLASSIAGMAASTSVATGTTVTASSSAATAIHSGIIVKSVLGAAACILAAAAAVYAHNNTDDIGIPPIKNPIVIAAPEAQTPIIAVPEAEPIPVAGGWMPGVQLIGAGEFQSPYAVRSVCFSPNSQYLATGCETNETKNGTIVIWDILKRQEFQRIPIMGTACDMQFNPNGEILYILTMVNQQDQDRLIAWDLRNEKVLFEIPVANHYGELAINQTQHALIAANGPKVDVREDSKPNVFERMMGKKHVPHWQYHQEDVQAWDMQTGDLLKTWKGVAGKQADQYFKVRETSCSDNGAMVLCVNRNNGSFTGNYHQIRVLDWTSAKILYEWKLDDSSLSFHGQVIWLPGDEYILIQNNKFSTVLNVTNGDFVAQFMGLSALTTDKKHIVSVHENGVTFYSSDTFEFEKELPLSFSQCKQLSDLTISQDGKWLSGCIQSKQAPFLYDLHQEKLITPQIDVLQARPMLHYSGDGRLYACDGDNSWTLNDSGRKIKSISGLALSRHGSSPSRGESPDGRMLLLAEQGGAVLWDTLSGSKLVKLAGHRGGYVDGAFLSPEFNYAATLGQYDGKLKIHDMGDGHVLSVISGPRHNFFKESLHLAGLFWDSSRGRVAIGDTNAVWFNDKKEMTKASMYGTLDVAGIIDVNTGKRVHQFVDDKGTAAVMVHLMASGNGSLYGSASFGFKPFATSATLTVPADSKWCLWSMSDASFIRFMPDIGENVQFNADASLLYGTKGIVDTGSGKFIAQFDEHWICSPSYSLALSIDKNLVLQVLDVHSRHVLWQQSMLAETAEKAAEKTLEQVLWHPAENMLALTLKEQVALLQVPLFKAIEFPKDLSNELAMQMLVQENIQQRMQAASYFWQQGAASIPVLKSCFESRAGEVTLQQSMSVFILEHLARRGIAEAASVLRTIDLASARNAVDRLQRAQEVQLKKEALAKAEPVHFSWKNGFEAKPEAEAAKPMPELNEVPSKLDDF